MQLAWLITAATHRTFLTGCWVLLLAVDVVVVVVVVACFAGLATIVAEPTWAADAGRVALVGGRTAAIAENEA